MSQNLIAAIEIGSQQISALIGRKEPDGAIQVVAAAQEPSSKFVQRGRIFNPDLMTQSLKTIIDRLENQSHKAVQQIYVGVGGMGLRSMRNQITRTYGEATKITQEIVDSILDENRSLAVPGFTILNVLTQEYKLGVQALTDPVGVQANKVIGNFLDIIVPSNSHEMLEQSFRAAQLPIAEVRVSPLSLASIVLTDAERLSGCAFVDMGSETTTISIYASRLLRHLAVLPLGGANVTRDLMTSLSIEEDEAEEIKHRYGKAFLDPSASVESPTEPVHLRDGRSIAYDQVVGIIEARMNEILQNIAHIIRNHAGYKPDSLIGGLIVTGGTSNMDAVEKGLAEYTQIRKIRFVKNAPVAVRANKIQNFNGDGTYNTVLSIIDSATMDCCADERKPDDLFDGPTPEEIEAQQKQEEEARKAAAEEEERKRLAEEEERKRKEEERKRNRFRGLKHMMSSMKKGMEVLFTEEKEYDDENEE